MTALTTTVAGPAGATPALVMGPVLPQWDGGRFFAPLTDRLVELGHRVTLVDTLSLLDDGVRSFEDVLDRCVGLLSRLGPALLCGYAFGGAVAQGLLGRAGPGAVERVLLVSAPAVVDDVLRQRLEHVADLADQGETADAQQVLGRYLAPAGSLPPAAPLGSGERPSLPSSAGARMSRSLRLLTGADVRGAVRRHQGPLLSVVGGRSQLVARRHVEAGPGHRVLTVDGCGMRPHQERPEEVAGAVRDLLKVPAPRKGEA